MRALEPEQTMCCAHPLNPPAHHLVKVEIVGLPLKRRRATSNWPKLQMRQRIWHESTLAYHGVVAWEENTVAELAQEISDCLANGDADTSTRLAFRFIERYNKSDWETRTRITVDRPKTTGSARFDALLAGLVEYVCASHDVVAPAWVNDQSFFLDKWWFVSGMVSLHADALVHSPISLARRGVFVTQGALEYA